MFRFIQGVYSVQCIYTVYKVNKYSMYTVCTYKSGQVFHVIPVWCTKCLRRHFVSVFIFSLLCACFLWVFLSFNYLEYFHFLSCLFSFFCSTGKENSIYFIGFWFSLVHSVLFKKSLGEPGVQAIPHWIMWCAYVQVYKVFTVQQVNKVYNRCATGWWCSALPAGGQGLFVASPFPTILCKN